MQLRKNLRSILAALGMGILILDGKTALLGAQEGVELCIRTVIPSLFPFFILSIILTSSLSGMELPLFRPVGRLFRIPPGGEAILLTGFLGGYPVGAQTAAAAWKQGQLSREQAERMLRFCSNAGPAFLFGILANQFPGPEYPWLLWLVHILGALGVSLCYPPSDLTGVKSILGKKLSLGDGMKRAIGVLASVCGWVILFRVILRFLDRWILWMLPVSVRVLVCGILELANGCCSLSLIPDVQVRFLVASMILSFGGLCVTMQTVSVTEGLSIRAYLTGKLLQAGFSLLFAMVLEFPGKFWLAGIIVIPLTFAHRKRENNSSNPRHIGV